MLQERVPGLVEQRLQRVGVGGVAGLGALGLRHLQLVEQHHLQLLGRAEVDLLADHRVRRLGGVADLVGELALQLGQLVEVDGDARGLHLGEHPLHRQLHVAQQRRRVDAGQLLVERVGEVHHRAGAQDHGLHRLLVDALAVVEQRKLLLLRVIRAQLALQVAQRQVVEREAALARAAPGRRPARCRSVTPAQRPAAACEVVHRQLGLVQRLGLVGVGQPRRQRRLVVGVQRRRCRCSGRRRRRRRSPARWRRRRRPDGCRPRPARTGCPWLCSASHAGQLARLERAAAHVEALVDLGIRRRPACRTAGPAAPGTPGRRRAGGSGRGPTAASAACRASAPAARP